MRRRVSFTPGCKNAAKSESKVSDSIGGKSGGDVIAVGMGVAVIGGTARGVGRGTSVRAASSLRSDQRDSEKRTRASGLTPELPLIVDAPEKTGRDGAPRLRSTRCGGPCALARACSAPLQTV